MALTGEIDNITTVLTGEIDNTTTVLDGNLKVAVKGDKGDSATIEIGAVTKGDNPSVINVGTESSAVLNFVLPTSGTKGDKGDPGPTGPVGPKGDKGDKGDPGPAGPAGPKGDRGDSGVDGVIGKDGKSAYEVAVAAGFKGTVDEWLISIRGKDGETGPRGLTGPAGADGPVGPAGVKGNTGDPGPVGPKGDKGDTGDRGIAGPAGDVSFFNLNKSIAVTEWVKTGSEYSTTISVADYNLTDNDFVILKSVDNLAVVAMDTTTTAITVYIQEQPSTAINARFIIVRGAESKAAMITIGKVVTGSTAAVTNVGSSQSPILDFVLPKGDKGDKGETGPAGPQGIQGIQGVQGIQGEKGDKGDKGETGPAGNLGIYKASVMLTESQFDTYHTGSIKDVNIKNTDTIILRPYFYPTGNFITNGDNFDLYNKVKPMVRVVTDGAINIMYCGSWPTTGFTELELEYIAIH